MSMSVPTRTRRVWVVALVAAFTIAGAAPAARASGDRAAASGGRPPDGWLAVGEARRFFGLAAGNFPEGIAVGKRGVIYLGNRRDDGEHFVSEILAINDHEFLVIVRDAFEGEKAKTKSIVKIDIAGAGDAR